MFSLQFGIPVAPELLIRLLIVLPFAPAYWTYTDAERRGEDNAAMGACGV